MTYAYQIAKILLEKQAVTLNTAEPYTYVSGIRSPIYCDNRRLTFFPAERKIICQAFIKCVSQFNPEVIAGTASSAISWAAWVAAALEKPMVYIRKAAKKYGRQELIEGGDIEGRTVVVIEDLVSTGSSSLNAIRACQNAGATVLAMAAIFTYQFAGVEKKFRETGCDIRFLTDFRTLITVAAEQHFIELDQLAFVQTWNQSPQSWRPQHGFPKC